MRVLSLFVLATLSACTAADIQAPVPLDAADSVAAWTFADHVDDLRARSCPEGVAFQRAEDLPIRIIEAERGSESAQQMNLQGLTLAGAWQLESSNTAFGGLSGLEVMRSGSLLSITDDGKFVWISIDPETGVPDGLGSIAPMRNGEGEIFPNKRSADSEGLAFRDGIAFVSFEQDHRIEAYDLESCGSAAHAARVVKLDRVVDGRALGNNRGAEGLMLRDQNLVAGFESQASGGSPVGTVNTDGTLADVARTEQPLLFLLTGMDHQDGMTVKTFRAYDPVRGPRVILQVLDAANVLIAKATLKKPLPVDNFEAVALGTSPDGKTRIWVLSDDNFSADQRTLLLALDL
ncbi:MAG: esterase-like activity of phytase family protein [Henriciella sp.]